MRTLKSVHEPGRQVITRAIEIYATQPESPESPGKVDGEGQISLCAAAAVAAAGVEQRSGIRERQAFELAACNTPSKEVLFDTFELLGWDSGLCAQTVGFNDRCPKSLRRELVLRYLERGLSADADCLTV